MKNILLIFLFLCTSAFSAYARDFTVTVQVQADTDELGQTVETLLASELSSLKDVSITQTGEWIIRVMVMENKLPEGSEKSYTISAVITSQAKCTVLNGKSGTVSSEQCDRFENLGIFAGRMADIRDMCDELIADFNQASLEPLR